jgi:hypothetical protein
MHVNVGAGFLGQFHRSGYVVGVQVGVENVRDAHSFPFGRFEIPVDMAFGVHHERNSGSGTPDQVGIAAEAVHLELFEKHTKFSCSQTCERRGY